MTTEGQKKEPDLLEAAWALVGERGWAGWSGVELARRTGQPLTTVYALFPTRRHLVIALGHRLDAAMLGVPLAELDGMSVRERLFELAIRRFEAMRPFRAGLRAASREVSADPALLGAALGNLERATDWMMDAAGVQLSGLVRCLGRRALQLAYARAFRVWLDDDSADLSRTMAELDRRLGELAIWARLFGGRREEPGEAAAATG